MLRRVAILAAGGAGVAAAVLLAGFDRTDLVLDALLVFLAGLLAVTAARLTARALPAPSAVVQRALSPRPRPSAQPESLDRIEGLVALAQADQLDLHFRLRPLLADVAAAGYASKGGGESGPLPPAAEGTFSPETWALIRSDRPRPAGPGDRGIPTDRLAGILDELESILPP